MRFRKNCCSDDGDDNGNDIGDDIDDDNGGDGKARMMMTGVMRILLYFTICFENSKNQFRRLSLPVFDFSLSFHFRRKFVFVFTFEEEKNGFC